jgi:hypothetical protein
MRRGLTLTLLGAVLLLVAAAFTASYAALLGAAFAVGLRGAPAIAYAAVADLAALVAILALMVLRHDKTARKVATVTLAVFGISSGLLNGAAAIHVISHGMHAAPRGVPIWLALTIAAVPVIAISLGADLTMRVLASLWPSVEAATLTPRSTRPAKVKSQARRVKSPRGTVRLISRFPWVTVTRPLGLATVTVPVFPAVMTESQSGAKRVKSKTEAPRQSAPKLPAELVDQARTYARDARREGAKINRDAIRAALKVGAGRASALLDILRDEGLAA